MLVIDAATFSALVHAKEAVAQPVPVVIIQSNQFVHHPCIAIFAVGREAHHLVLFAEFVETNKLTQGGIEESKAIGESDTIQHLDAVRLAACCHHASEVARSVVGKARSQLVERRKKVGTCDMGQMM